jgi:hypothetical protein
MASWINVPDNAQHNQLDHILHNVLRLQNAPNEPVHIALNQAHIRTLSYLVERPTADIDALTCQPIGNDANGVAHPVEDLADHLKLQLKQAIAHVLEKNATFGLLNTERFDPIEHITVDSFGNFRLGRFTGAITLKEWREYCVEQRDALHQEFRRYEADLRRAWEPRPGRAKTEDFKKGIKRDTKLSHMSDWNKWHPAFVAVAKTHDCMDVLNPDYVPQPGGTPEAIEECALFQEKQVYMFLVMTLNFKEMKAASFVREHHVDNDAQAVWSKLLLRT